MKSLYCLLSLCRLYSIVSHSQPINHPKLRWAFKTQGTIRTKPVVEGEFVYVTSSDGHLYCLRKSDGSLHWKFRAGGAITASPAIGSTLVIVVSNDRTVYAIKKKDGTTAWTFQAEDLLQTYWEWDYFSAAPIIDSSLVLVGSGDGHVYALDLKNGNERWKLKTSGRIRAAGLMVESTLYQPSNDGNLYAVDRMTGTVKWKFATDGAAMDSRTFGWDRNSIYGAPVLSDSLLIFPSRDGKTYAVNIKTGRKVWDFTYGPSWAMSVAEKSGVAFVGWSDNSMLSAIDAETGKERWKFQAGSLVYTKPAFMDGLVLVGSADEQVYAVDEKTGSKMWTYRLGGPVFSSPTPEAGVIYIGCDDGYLYALEQGAQPLKAVYFPESRDKRWDGALIVDSKITPYLKEHGFSQLDSAGLVNFLRSRIEDRLPSVVVFPYDRIPSTVVGEVPGQGLFRRYLNAGGKVVWFGNVPNLIAIDAKGRPYLDNATAARMLETEFPRPEESGNYFSTATQAGLNLGFPAWLTTTYANVSDNNVVPLAQDEFGRTTAWMRKYNDRPGSGFYSFRTWGWYAPIHTSDLELILKIALYGLE